MWLLTSLNHLLPQSLWIDLSAVYAPGQLISDSIPYLLKAKDADPPPPLSEALSLLPCTVIVMVPDMAYSAL